MALCLTRACPVPCLLWLQEQIVRPQDVAKFEKLLQEHQNAVTKNGLTVLQNAIIEHNLFAASKIYNNIRIDELARLLNISPRQTEEIAASMIEQRRLNGTIDQVAGIIEFAEGSAAAVPVLCCRSPSPAVPRRGQQWVGRAQHV